MKPESSAVRWCTHSSTEETRKYVKQLTDEELPYCYAKDTRKTSQRMYLSEAKRRGIVIHRIEG